MTQAEPPSAAPPASAPASAPTRWLLACLLALAAGLRLWWALHFDTLPNHDAKAYLEFARAIADGQGYIAFGQPTAYWPVGYPAMLAAVLKLGGGELLAGRIAQALFGLVSTACVYPLVLRWSGSRVGALLAVGLMALDPTQLGYTSLLISEPLFNCLALGGAALAVTATPGRTRLAVAGGLLGLAALTRAQGLLLPALVGLWGALPGVAWSWRAAARRLLWLHLGLVLVMAPWWARNAQVFGAFVPVSTNGGINLFIGNNPAATGGYKWGREIKAPIAARHKGRHRGGHGEYERGQVAAGLAIEYMRAHPGRTLALADQKLRRLLRGDRTPVHWNRSTATDTRRKNRFLRGPFKRFQARFHLLLCLLAGLGAALCLGRSRAAVAAVHLFAAGTALHYRQRLLAALLAAAGAVRLRWPAPWRPASPLPVAVVGAMTALQLLFFANPRFLFPMRPWLAMLAALSVVWVCAVLARLRASRG